MVTGAQPNNGRDSIYCTTTGARWSSWAGSGWSTIGSRDAPCVEPDPVARICKEQGLVLVSVLGSLLMGFMGVTAFLSMWISNTATTAMIVPIAHVVLEQLHKSEQESSSREQEVTKNGHINGGFELQETAHQPGRWPWNGDCLNQLVGGSNVSHTILRVSSGGPHLSGRML